MPGTLSRVISAHLLPPDTTGLLWFAAASGWLVVLIGLWCGLTGETRKATVTAHGLSLGGVMLPGPFLGFGFLYALAAASAAWWALAVVTGFRPERLVDPQGGALPRLALWLMLGTAATLLVQSAVL